MTDELMLDSAGPTATGFEIKTHAGGPQTAETLLFIADSMRSMLDEYDAPNYLEMEVEGTDHKRYIMTLQRAGKITPHSARLAAEAEVAKLTAEVAYQKARAAYFKYVPEIEEDPEGVQALVEEMRDAREAFLSAGGQA